MSENNKKQRRDEGVEGIKGLLSEQVIWFTVDIAGGDI